MLEINELKKRIEDIKIEIEKYEQKQKWKIPRGMPCWFCDSDYNAKTIGIYSHEYINKDGCLVYSSYEDVFYHCEPCWEYPFLFLSKEFDKIKYDVCHNRFFAYAVGGGLRNFDFFTPYHDMEISKPQWIIDIQKNQ